MNQRRSSRAATSWRPRLRASLPPSVVSVSASLDAQAMPRLPPQPPPVPVTAEHATLDSRQQPSLVCFLACHISQPHRIETLRWTLNSFAAQRAAPLPPATLRVSYSASPVVADGVRAMLQEAAQRNPSLAVYERAAPQSQFEHLRTLTREAIAFPTPPEWIYFSDDDDLWSEHRHKLFHDACRAADKKPSVHAVCCTRKARPEKKEDDADDDGSPAEGVDGGASYVTRVPDAAAARALVASGAARLTDLEAFDLSVESFNMDEYFDYAVRLDVLTSFFKLAPNALVKHKLCDLAFISSHVKAKASGSLNSGVGGASKGAKTIQRFTPDAPDEFVYFYTRQENAPYVMSAANARGAGPAGASTGVEVSDAELKLARLGRPALIQAFGGDSGFDESGILMDEERLAFFLSALRQAIEQELVQLRLMSACPKVRQTDDICRRHLDMLLETHPMKGTKEIVAFRSWSFEQARGPILQGLLRLLCFDLPKGRRM